MHQSNCTRKKSYAAFQITLCINLSMYIIKYLKSTIIKFPFSCPNTPHNNKLKQNKRLRI